MFKSGIDVCVILGTAQLSAEMKMTKSRCRASQMTTQMAHHTGKIQEYNHDIVPSVNRPGNESNLANRLFSVKLRGSRNLMVRGISPERSNQNYVWLNEGSAGVLML